MGLRNVVYGGYEALLTRDLRSRGSGPCHIGVILDGNRRWAKLSGTSEAHGHQRGADKITEVLEWSKESGVQVVTLSWLKWRTSTKNQLHWRRSKTTSTVIASSAPGR